MAAMPIYGESLYNLIFQIQKSGDLGTLLGASGTQVYKVCINDDHWLTLTYLTAMLKLANFCFLCLFFVQISGER